jgi:GT2 family glycosyltransferase
VRQSSFTRFPTTMTVGIAVLNWNNAVDTVSCIDSLADLRCSDFILYVVDNGSTDGSAAILERHLRIVARRLGGSMAVGEGERWWDISPLRPGDIALLLNGVNLGYSGGNNIAIRRAVADDCSGVWVLNNDTRVDASALDRILEVATPEVAVVGMQILDYDHPTQIQCMGGGFYNWWTTRTRLNGAGLPQSRMAEALEKPVAFISGASMYLPRETLQSVGYLDERYFLYCEEVDFAERCRRRGRDMVVAPNAIVWHKYGSSAGSSRKSESKSTTSVFFSTESRLLLTRRHRPNLVPIVIAARIAYALSLVVRGRWRLGSAVLQGIFRGLRRTTSIRQERSRRAVNCADGSSAP